MMTFIHAMSYAVNDIGIRRSIWAPNVRLDCRNHKLYWSHTGFEAMLLDDDISVGISERDLKSEDWEVYQ